MWSASREAESLWGLSPGNISVFYSLFQCFCFNETLWFIFIKLDRDNRESGWLYHSVLVMWFYCCHHNWDWIAGFAVQGMNYMWTMMEIMLMKLCLKCEWSLYIIKKTDSVYKKTYINYKEGRKPTYDGEMSLTSFMVIATNNCQSLIWSSKWQQLWHEMLE